MMLYDFERVKIMKRLFITISIFTILVLTGCGWNPFGPGDGSEPPRFDPWPIGPVDYDPAWSPDGSIITYYHAANYSDSTTDTCGLYFINPDGTNRRLFLNATVEGPDWSPDGEWIVFSHYTGVIYKIKVNGDSLTQLTFNRRTFYPDWSPDGKKIAYDQSISTVTHPYGTWMMNADGSDDHLVMRNGGYPDWSPDGTKFVYAGGPGPTNAESQIWVADTNGTNATQLTFEGHCNRYPVFSPDGSNIAFASRSEHESGIWVIDSNGNNLQQLAKDVCIEPCCWSPDGKYIIYTTSPEGYWVYDTLPGGCVVTDSVVYKPGTGRLWVMNADGTDKYQLTFP